jgi:hypothetical protein
MKIQIGHTQWVLGYECPPEQPHRLACQYLPQAPGAVEEHGARTRYLVVEPSIRIADASKALVGITLTQNFLFTDECPLDVVFQPYSVGYMEHHILTPYFTSEPSPRGATSAVCLLYVSEDVSLSQIEEWQRSLVEHGFQKLVPLVMREPSLAKGRLREYRIEVVQHD